MDYISIYGFSADVIVNMMSEYYVSWCTWQEQQIDTPWDFWYLQRLETWKPRRNCASKLHVTPNLLQNAWLQGRSDILDEVEANFVQGVLLCAFVQAGSEQEAGDAVTKVFADAHIQRVTLVDPATRDAITQLFAQTEKRGGNSAPPP